MYLDTFSKPSSSSVKIEDWVLWGTWNYSKKDIIGHCLQSTAYKEKSKTIENELFHVSLHMPLTYNPNHGSNVSSTNRLTNRQTDRQTPSACLPPLLKLKVNNLPCTYLTISKSTSIFHLMCSVFLREWLELSVSSVWARTIIPMWRMKLPGGFAVIWARPMIPR